MTQPTQPARPDADRPDSDIADVRTLLANADRHLLGATISVSDDDWRTASTLPGWTRGHVATHLCRHADAFNRLVDGVLTGTEQEMYPGDRDAEIADGAGRSGLEIQTDLDTSIGRLEAGFEKLAEADGWETPVRLRDGNRIRAGLLPAGRLFEVVLHHIDLDIGMTLDAIDRDTAEACLRMAAVRQRGRTDYPALRLTTTTEDGTVGSSIDIGAAQSSEPTVVTGPAHLLLGWLTQRSGTEGLAGDPPALPSFG